MKKLLIIVGQIVLLTGCSTVFTQQNLVAKRDNEYLNAQNTQTLIIPDGVSDLKVGNDYSIPSYNYIVPKQPASMVPPGSAAAR